MFGLRNITVMPQMTKSDCGQVLLIIAVSAIQGQESQHFQRHNDLEAP